MSDLKAKMHKFDFRWGSAPDPAGGAYRAPPDPLVVFKGHTSKGREEKREGRVVPPTGSLDPPVTHAICHCHGSQTCQ